MKYKKFGNIYIVKLQKGEEIIKSLQDLAKDQAIKFAWVGGLGAVSKISLGFYDMESRQYVWKDIQGNIEVTALSGDISWMEGKPIIHIHLGVADEDQLGYGGHLKEAVVGGTIELRVEAFEEEIKRQFDEETGLNLLEI